MVRKAKPQKPATPVKKPRSAKKPTPEQVFRMIQEAAFLKAEKDEFTKEPSSYWLAAEGEIYRKYKLRKA
jgi:hypothetical protein